MSVESSYALLSVKLHQKGFVHNPTYLRGIETVFNEYGLLTSRKTQGIITFNIEEQIFPVAVVDSEKIFKEVNPLQRKYKIGQMTPEEWFEKQLILIDGNWMNDAMVADLILQTYFFLNKYNRNDQKVNLIGIPERAAQATTHFLVQDLFEQYRGRYLDWLQQAI